MLTRIFSKKVSVVAVLLFLIVGMLFYSNSMITRYTEVLVQRGVPAEFIEQTRVGPITAQMADQIAIAYFTEELLAREIPAEFIEQSQIRPISSETAEQLVIAYFTQDLILRGVPARFIKQSEIKRDSPEAVDEIAIAFFTQDLISKGVPAEFIEETGIDPISFSIASAIKDIYQNQKALEEEQLALQRELEQVERAVLEQLEPEIKRITVAVKGDLKERKKELEKELEAQLDAVLTPLANQILLCTAVSFTPVIGDVVDFWGSIWGKDPCTQQELEPWERVVGLFGVAEFKKVGKVFDVILGANKVRRFIKIARSAQHVDELNDFMKTAKAFGVAERLEPLLDAARGLDRTDDLNGLVKAAKVLGVADEVGELVDVVRVFEKADDLDDLLDVMKVVERSKDFNKVANATQKIRQLSRIEVLSDAGKFVKNSQKARQLSLLEQVFKYSGLADDLSDATKFLKKHDSIKRVIKDLDKWDDYLDFVKGFPPSARQASLEVFVLERIRKKKPYRFVVKKLGEKAVAYINEEKKEVLEIKYYEGNQNELDKLFKEELESYRPFVEEGYTLNYVFGSQPPQSMIDQIEEVGGNVYWMPDKLP